MLLVVKMVKINGKWHDDCSQESRDELRLIFKEAVSRGFFALAPAIVEKDEQYFCFSCGNLLFPEQVIDFLGKSLDTGIWEITAHAGPRIPFSDFGFDTNDYLRDINFNNIRANPHKMYLSIPEEHKMYIDRRCLDEIVLYSMLTKNYNEKQVSPECKIKTLEYVANHLSVEHQDVLFTKKLTKVAHSIMQSGSNGFEGFYDRLYDFSFQGVEKAAALLDEINSNPDSCFRDCFSENQLVVMKSHFYGYCGKFAMKNYFSNPGSENLDWLLKAYIAFKKATLTASFSDKEIEFSVCAQRDAGDVVKILFDGSENKYLADKAIKCYDIYLNYYNRIFVSPGTNMHSLISEVRKKRGDLIRLLDNYDKFN